MSIETLAKRHIPKASTGDKGLDDAINEQSEAVLDIAQNVVEGFDVVCGRIDQIEARINREGLGPSAANQDISTEVKNFFAACNKPVKDVSREHVEQYKDYCKAYAQYTRLGGSAPPSVFNSLSVGSNPDGGYYVPSATEGRTVQRIFETSPIRQVASVITIGAGSELTGIVDRDEVTSGWVGEWEERNETDSPQIGEWKIPVHEQVAMPIATQKLLDDASIDIDSWLTGKISGKFARTENTSFVSGNGIKKPRGFLDYESTTEDDDTRAWGKLQHINTSASGAFPTLSGGADDPAALYDCIAALKAPYRANAVWMMNRSTTNVVRKLRDADGRFLWRDGLEPGQADFLLGYRVVMAEDMPAIAANSLSIAFGDFGAGYQIVDKLGIQLLRDPYTTKGRVKFYTRKRVGGDVIDFEAIKLVRFGTA